MKIKKIIAIILILVLILETIILAVSKLYKKSSKSILERNFSSNFKQKFNITNEEISNKNNFKYQAKIVSKNQENELRCVTIDFYDKDKNILLSYNEYINISISDMEGYEISASNPSTLDVASIEYKLCE